MQLFVSTTFYKQTATNVAEVLRKLKDLDIDGVELGSTHIFRSDMEDVIRKEWNKRIVTHNFFPPAKDKNFVMNISSNNSLEFPLYINFSIGLNAKPISGILVKMAPKPIGSNNNGSNFLLIAKNKITKPTPSIMN